MKKMKQTLKNFFKNKKALYGAIGVAVLIIVGLILLLTLGRGKTYTVSFDSDGGSSVESIMVKEGEVLVLPANPTKKGFRFNGWLLDGRLFAPSTPITQDLKLKASWISKDAKTYKVSFNADNGSDVVTVEVVEGKKAIKPQDPTKDKATFKGWFLDDAVYDFEQPVTSDISLVAQWGSAKKEEAV